LLANQFLSVVALARRMTGLEFQLWNDGICDVFSFSFLDLPVGD